MSKQGSYRFHNASALLKKRPRNYNFTIPEKLHFLDCLEQYISITENRRLDTSAVIQKKKTWDLLVAKYNERFPNGPQRDYSQLKDLYRRMKILARKVHAQRQRELEPGEQPIVADQPTERLIDMIFSLNSSVSPSDYLDVELVETGNTDEDVSTSLVIDQDSTNTSSNASENSSKPNLPLYKKRIKLAAVKKEISSSNPRNGRASPDDHVPKKVKANTSSADLRLPRELQITEVPVYMPIGSSESQFTDVRAASEFAENQERCTRLSIDSGDKTGGLSSQQLNRHLLEMARAEHHMKMQVHQSCLEILELQKQKLLKELDSV